MLLQAINKNYLYIGILLFAVFTASIINDSHFVWMHIVSFLSFCIYGIVMFQSTLMDNSFFRKRNLALIVFTVSIAETTLFVLLSYYINDDFFVFSKADALLYYRESMKMAEMSFIDSYNYYVDVLNFGTDDIGAFFSISTIFRIIPSQLFLYFCYCIVGTISSLMLFDISRNFMPRRYAFLSALSFSSASFILTFQSTCTKETVMLACIIASFYYFSTYTRKKRIKDLCLTLVFCSLILFFRVPTALLLVFSLGLTWVLLYMKGPAAIALIVVFVLAIGSTSLFSFTYNRYLRGGDTELIMERKNRLAGGGGIVNQLADPVAALTGPFPSIHIKEIKKTPLYASGLLYRFLLSAPFFLGAYFIIKNRYIKMYPFVIFFLINAIGVSISVKGLEARLSMPHLSMMYIVAFWFLAKYDYDQFAWKISPQLIYGYFIGIFGLCLLWNLR